MFFPEPVFSLIFFSFGVATGLGPAFGSWMNLVWSLIVFAKVSQIVKFVIWHTQFLGKGNFEVEHGIEFPSAYFFVSILTFFFIPDINKTTIIFNISY